MYLVIDTWVWKAAQEGKNYDSLMLLAGIARKARKCRFRLIIDYDNEILEEYKKHLKDNIVKKIFLELVKRGKIEHKPKAPIVINDFDKDDLKYIQVAVTILKHNQEVYVISGDSDFIELRKRIKEHNDITLRELSKKILTPEEALSKINL